MKTSTTKIVMELKGELKLISFINPTLAMLCWDFDFHNNNDIVNPKLEVTYKSEPKAKKPPIFKEFFRPLVGLI